MEKTLKKIAKAIGLKGPMRSAEAGEKLLQQLRVIESKLGVLPYGRLNVPRPSANSSVKRPRAKCLKCGYEIVMLKKHIDKGPPLCPKDIVLIEEIGEW